MVRVYRGKYDAYHLRVDLESRDLNLNDGQRVHLVNYIALCQLYEKLKDAPDSAKATLLDVLFRTTTLERILRGDDDL